MQTYSVLKKNKYCPCTNLGNFSPAVISLPTPLLFIACIITCFHGLIKTGKELKRSILFTHTQYIIHSNIYNYISHFSSTRNRETIKRNCEIKRISNIHTPHQCIKLYTTLTPDLQCHNLNI